MGMGGAKCLGEGRVSGHYVFAFVVTCRTHGNGMGVRVGSRVGHRVGVTKMPKKGMV